MPFTLTQTLTMIRVGTFEARVIATGAVVRIMDVDGDEGVCHSNQLKSHAGYLRHASFYPSELTAVEPIMSPLTAVPVPACQTCGGDELVNNGCDCGRMEMVVSKW